MILTACISVLILAAAIASPVQAQAQAPETSPASTQDQRELAQQYMASGDYDKAIECLVGILAGNPADATSLKADLGLCYKFKQDYAQAMPLFAEVGAVTGPRQAKALFWIEDCYREQGKFADAVEHLNKMYVDHPDLRVQVLARRGSRHEDAGQPKEALADYKEYLALGQDDELSKRFKLKIAELTYTLNGNGSEFAVALQQAAEAATAETDAVLAKSLTYDLGQVYMRTEQWDRAISLFQSLMIDYPADALAHKTNLGLSYKGKRDYDNAMQTLKEVAASAKDAQQKEVSFWIVDCLTEQSKNEEAITYLDQLVADHPDWRANTLYRRAVCKCDLKQYKESIADLQQYLKDYPDQDDAKYVELMTAQITLYNLRDTGAARKLLNDFIAKRPDYPEIIVAKTELAYCSYIEGNYAEAASLFDDATKAPERLCEGYRPFCIHMVGMSHKMAGNTAGVQDALERLTKLYPDDTWTRISPGMYVMPVATEKPVAYVVDGAGDLVEADSAAGVEILNKERAAK